jgi:hypothetical protein
MVWVLAIGAVVCAALVIILAVRDIDDGDWR